MDEIGAFLKKLRGNMTFREAAERSGLSHSYIRYLEIGKRPGTNTPIKPSPEMLRGLAKAYNHPYSELMKMAGYSDEVDREYDTIEEETEIERIIRETNEVLKTAKNIEQAQLMLDLAKNVFKK